jgi:hypothetical protein
VIPLAERILLQLWWTDATNVAGGWFDGEDLGAWAVNGAWEASNTGWLVYEDDKCYVLAGRMTDDGKNVGLVERIPKAAVTRKAVLGGPAEPPAPGVTALPCIGDPPGTTGTCVSTATLPGTVVVNVSGSVTTENELVDLIQRRLLEQANRSWSGRSWPLRAV